MTGNDIFPKTEAFRQAIALVNALPVADSSLDVFFGSGSASEPSTTAQRTLRFIIDQLVFTAVNSEAQVDALLSQCVVQSLGGVVSLSNEWRALIAARWLRDGKGLVQKCRDAAVANFASRQSPNDERLLGIESNVLVCQGHVVEDDEAVLYSNEVSLHKPRAILCFPMTAHHPSGLTVSMAQSDVCRLFEEIDRIQAAVDQITGAR